MGRDREKAKIVFSWSLFVSSSNLNGHLLNWSLRKDSPIIDVNRFL